MGFRWGFLPLSYLAQGQGAVQKHAFSPDKSSAPKHGNPLFREKNLSSERASRSRQKLQESLLRYGEDASALAGVKQLYFLVTSWLVPD